VWTYGNQWCAAISVYGDLFLLNCGSLSTIGTYQQPAIFQRGGDGLVNEMLTMGVTPDVPLIPFTRPDTYTAGWAAYPRYDPVEP